MDPRLLGREAKQRTQVVDVRVNPAVGDKPQQVDVLAAFECRTESLVLEERAVFDRLRDPGEILVEPSSRANRQVADLGVPHLSRGQTDRLTRGCERRVRVCRPEPVEDRRARKLDCVARPRRSAPPAVEDDERYERMADAASQISANDSTSSDAPPTSAPSTPGCARSSSAFSGFTEPP